MSHCWIASNFFFCTLQTFQTKIYQHNNIWETGKRVDEIILHMSALFVLKVAPNHGKRYSELPKAIPCNIFKYSLLFHCPGSHYSTIGCCLIPMSHRAPLHILSFACRSYVSTNSFVWWGFASSWRSIWFFQVMQGLSFDSLCSSRCHPLLWCLDWWWRGSDIPWHVVEEESLWNMTRDQIDRLLGSTQLSLSEKYTLKSG